jgi:hypothetical protein
LLESPRRRRRAAWIGSGVLAVAVVVTVGIVSSHNGSTPSAETDTVETGTVQASAAETEVALKPADRRAINATLQRFVDTAVARHDVAGSYGLVSSDLREGMSRSEWAKGNIPVYPYPAARQHVEISFVDFSYARDVQVDTLLQPRAGAKTGPLAFSVELKKIGGRWLVSSWLPQKQLPPSAAPSAPKAKPVKLKYPLGRGHLSAKWLVLPAGILALIVLVPLGFALRGLLRRRRIERRFRSERPLPPLPRRDS